MKEKQWLNAGNRSWPVRTVRNQGQGIERLPYIFSFILFVRAIELWGWQNIYMFNDTFEVDDKEETQ